MNVFPSFLRRFQLINEEFTLFLAGRMLFISGLRMTPVLLGWKLYEITGSKLALGILGLSEVIPAIAFSLPAGVRVDRSDKRKLIARCMLLYVLINLGFVAITLPVTHTRIGTSMQSWCLYALVFFTGMIRAYSGPAFNAFISQLVKPEEMVNAISINSMVWLVAAVVGPGLAGLLLGFTDITLSFAIATGLIFTGYLLFRPIRSKPISWQPSDHRTWDSVKEGLRFVWHKKALLSAMSLDMFAVLFGGAVALLPVFAKDILSVGPQGLGWLISATYMGNFLAIAWLTYKPIRKKQGKRLLIMVAGFGLSILGFALSKNYFLSFFFLFCSGLFDGVSMIIRSTVVQLFVPEHMRGRVSSVNSIFVNSSNELGQFESGVAASLLGTVPSVLFGGCMTLLVTFITWAKSKPLRQLEY
jgi:MFS family permease